MKNGWLGRTIGNNALAPLAVSEVLLVLVAATVIWREPLSSWLTLALVAFLGLHGVMLWRFMRESQRAKHHLMVAKEAADQANLTRGAFLSTMSHEIRTPMNAIVGMTGLLRATRLDAQQQEFAKAVEDSANALLGIINDVLDFSKIDVGKMDIAVMEFDLADVVESSLDVLALKAHEKKVRLISYIDPRLPAQLIGDPGRIRQILLNLVGNALKFTNRGEVSVKLTQIRGIDDTGRVRIEVQDSGIGMDEETVRRLFTPFTQADGSVTRKYGGTGLGLSICKRLVELMGGDIGVTSVPGVGSCFWFELALPEGRTRAAPASVAGATSKDMRVMLVEPHDASARMINDYLQATGISVSRYRSAEDALLVLQAGAQIPQACIVSSELTAMPASQLLERLRQARPQLRCLLLDHGTRSNSAVDEERFGGTLRLPLKRKQLLDMVSGTVEMPPSASETPLAQTRSIEAGPAEILLVEDNIMNQKVAIYQLNAMGYAADIAVNGSDALERLALRDYALVLMDCQMPVLDGYETTKRIRRLEQGAKHTPVVAMTANAMAGDRQLCLDAGMDDYLTKPLLRSQLAAVLEKYLAARPAPAVALDENRLDELFGDDEALKQEMLEMFIEHTEPLIEQLSQLIHQGSGSLYDALSLGHRLAGSCANLGIRTLGALGRKLEEAARQGDQEQMHALATQCGEAFAQLRQRVYSQTKDSE